MVLFLLTSWGCDTHPSEESSVEAVPQQSATPAVSGDDGADATNTLQESAFPPAAIELLADTEVRTRFSDTSFAWSNGSVNWDVMTREERRAALLGDGLVRNTYSGTVRIKEAYYAPRILRSRWQEELRNDVWVRHGPEVYYHQDGRIEVLFRLDGEIEGTRGFYKKDGTLIRAEKWREGMPTDA